MKREYDAYTALRDTPRRAVPVGRITYRLTDWLGAIADRMAPLLALCGLMAALGYLADVIHGHVVPLHLLWALLALVCAVVAMRAFWD